MSALVNARSYFKMSITRLFFFFFFFISAWAEESNSNPIVRIAHGELQGTWKVSTKGRTYASFQGIPYARPPIGKYRFREPQQLKPWSGVWDATRTLSDCVQYDPFMKSVTGSENCLFVNVYTPRLNAGANLPVMVYIYGGAFLYGGSSLYGVSNFMDVDMVVVTFNYRLGPLGFLSTGDEVVPGNAGLKDQSLALQWVKNNIMMFGGNPNSVTLTGCSAGGASVHYHYLSAMSKGTFARGIAFSGSAFAPWAYAAKPAEKAKNLAGIVGCPTSPNYDMVECLKYRPAEVIVNAQAKMLDWRVQLFTVFTPTAEAPGSRRPFLTQYPYHAAMSGAMQKLPLITSVNSEEGLYPAAAYQNDPTILEELETKWAELASNIFEYNDTLPLALRPSVADKIKQHYLGGKPVSQETYPQLVQALGDRLFVADVGRLAQVHADHSGQPVYVYRNSYRAEISLSNMISGNNENYGVSHSDDVFLFFNLPAPSNRNSEEMKMAETFINLIYTYSTTGVPKVLDDGAEWQQVAPGSPEIKYLEISTPTDTEMKSSSDFGQRSFWDNLGFIENVNYQINLKDEL